MYYYNKNIIISIIFISYIFSIHSIEPFYLEKKGKSTYFLLVFCKNIILFSFLFLTEILKYLSFLTLGD